LNRLFHFFRFFCGSSVPVNGFLQAFLQRRLLSGSFFGTLGGLFPEILFLFQLCSCGNLFRFRLPALLLQRFHLLL